MEASPEQVSFIDRGTPCGKQHEILTAGLGVVFINLSEMCHLTHWGRVTHICVSKLTIIGSDNALSPGRRQAIIWTNDGILLIWTLGTNFSKLSSEIHAVSFKKMHLKRSSAKWRPFCLGLNVLNERDDLRFYVRLWVALWHM